jgi:hypothetical protein
MGKIFNTNSWRAPLQLIDCWLPLPSQARSRQAGAAAPAKAVQRFARAGWLNREAANSPGPQVQVASSDSRAQQSCRLHVLRRTTGVLAKRPEVGLVLSGPIGDVCAELDRLAALEQANTARVA